MNSNSNWRLVAKLPAASTFWGGCCTQRFWTNFNDTKNKKDWPVFHSLSLSSPLSVVFEDSSLVCGSLLPYFSHDNKCESHPGVKWGLGLPYFCNGKWGLRHWNLDFINGKLPLGKWDFDESRIIWNMDLKNLGWEMGSLALLLQDLLLFTVYGSRNLIPTNIFY